MYGVEESKIKSLNLPYEQVRDAFRISVKDTEQARDFEISKGKMDDVFLSVTGKKLEGGNL